jgi:hypothetical protein
MLNTPAETTRSKKAFTVGTARLEANALGEAATFVVEHACKNTPHTAVAAAAAKSSHSFVSTAGFEADALGIAAA